MNKKTKQVFIPEEIFNLIGNVAKESNMSFSELFKLVVLIGLLVYCENTSYALRDASKI